MTGVQIVAEPGVPQIVITREFDAAADRADLRVRPAARPHLPEHHHLRSPRIRTRLRQNTVFQSVEDRDVYLLGGMERGVHASMAQLDELVTSLPQ